MGAGALVACWLLSVLLGLVLALLGRILWGLKLALFLAAFVAPGEIRARPPPPGRCSSWPCWALYALLSRLTGTPDASREPSWRPRCRGLERQVEELRWRQRRAVKAPDVEEE